MIFLEVLFLIGDLSRLIYSVVSIFVNGPNIYEKEEEEAGNTPFEKYALVRPYERSK